MNKNSFVSFIVPVYNSADTIKKCLESMQNISYPKNKFEIILVDNNSKDRTIDIARKFTSKIYVDSTATISTLRNIGAKKAKGDILCFVDADCVISKGWLRDALENLKDDDAAMTSSKLYSVPEEASWVARTWQVHLTGRNKGKKKVKWFAPCALAIKKHVFLSIAGFDESLVTCEDTDLGYRVGRKHRIISDKRLIFLHLHEPKTLFEFFQKEYWRGKDSVKVSLKYIKEPKEILSLMMLVYYSILGTLFFPTIVIMFITKNAIYATVVLFGLILPFVIVSFDTCRRTGEFLYFGKLMIVYATYVAARVRSIFWQKK